MSYTSYVEGMYPYRTKYPGCTSCARYVPRCTSCVRVQQYCHAGTAALLHWSTRQLTRQLDFCANIKKIISHVVIRVECAPPRLTQAVNDRSNLSVNITTVWVLLLSLQFYLCSVHICVYEHVVYTNDFYQGFSRTMTRPAVKLTACCLSRADATICHHRV